MRIVGFVVAAAMAAGCGSTDGGRATANDSEAGLDGAADQSVADATSADDVDTDAGALDAQDDDDGAPGDCCLTCTTGANATLQLSCATTEPPTAVVTGPCMFADASPPGTTVPGIGCSSTQCTLFALTSGDCHVVLTFAGGFTYTTDVEFMDVPQACCGCPGTALAASPTGAMVDNPMATCAASDAGGE
jgi:hypothetical protein